MVDHTQAKHDTHGQAMIRCTCVHVLQTCDKNVLIRMWLGLLQLRQSVLPVCGCTGSINDYYSCLYDAIVVERFIDL